MVSALYTIETSNRVQYKMIIQWHSQLNEVSFQLVVYEECLQEAKKKVFVVVIKLSNLRLEDYFAVDLIFSRIFIYKRQQKVKWGKSRGRFEDAVLEDWSDVATNQGMPVATRWWRGKGRILPKNLQWEGNPTNTLIPVQQYWLKNSVLPNLGGGGYTVGHHTYVTCYSSHRKKPRSILSQLLAKHSKRGGIWTWPWGNWFI